MPVQKMEEMIQYLGWKRPSDTDSNSSNCLLNTLGISIHQKKYGFHPYISEVANMVREGVMSRKEALEKMAKPVDEELAKQLHNQIKN